MPRLVSALLLLCLGLTPAASHAPPRPTQLWLWAWERSEDLRFLEPGIGVAFLARTVTFGPRGVTVIPRAQPLLLPRGMVPQAVTRLTLATGYLEGREHGVTASELHALAAAILQPIHESPLVGLQLDFDARASERGFEQALLTELHTEMHATDTHLSFSRTRLAAKCLHEDLMTSASDPEITEDRVVPMLFSLGPDAPEVRLALNAVGDFPSVLCREAIGIMVGDPLPSFARDRTLYVFSRSPWTPSLVERVRLLMPTGRSE